MVREVNHSADTEGQRPIVFVTLVNRDLDDILKQSHGMVLDMFNTFIEPLEAEFGVKSNHRIGRFSDVREEPGVHRPHRGDQLLARPRRWPVGQSNLAEADVILVGVSRSGKTPTSLYLAMQHGIKAPTTRSSRRTSTAPDPLDAGAVQRSVSA